MRPDRDGGSVAPDAGATPPELPCTIEGFYRRVANLADNDCALGPDVDISIFAWALSLVPVPLMGETRRPEDCEFTGWCCPLRQDENGNPIGGAQLCINRCDAVRNWLVSAREENACLDERFPADAGTAVPADAGTDN
jgi:hypothetical protein